MALNLRKKRICNILLNKLITKIIGRRLVEPIVVNDDGSFTVKFLNRLEVVDIKNTLSRYPAMKHMFALSNATDKADQTYLPVIKRDKPYDLQGIIDENKISHRMFESFDAERQSYIDGLRKLGKEYDFDRFSTAQLYNIYHKTLNKAKADNRADMLNPDDYVLVGEKIKRCEKCGTRLNDSGECPVCDLGDESALEEDTIKRNGKWMNKGKEGTHGKFYTKKAADAQRKAMFANGYHEELETVDEDIEKHEELNPKLWTADNKLKPEVHDKILEIVKDFTDGLEEDGIKFNVVDVQIVGSNCSYNYNKDSDLDIHIFMDMKSLKCPDNLYPLLYSAYRSIWNKNHDVSFYGIPVEIFIEDAATSELKSNGIYSVMRSEWVKEPVQQDIPDIDYAEFDKVFAPWEERYYEIIEDPSYEKIDSFMDEIYALRKKSIAEDGEYGIGNLVFKECRSLGYLDDLKKIKQDINNAELSLTEAEKAKKTRHNEPKELSEYLNEITYTSIDYDVIKQVSTDVVLGKCSSVRKNNIVGRNLDWFYSDLEEFIVHIKAHNGLYASINVADLPKAITKELSFELLPFATVDGMNEKGLAINYNVCPDKDGLNPSGAAGDESKEKLDSHLVCRYVLDHYATCDAAVKGLQENVRIETNPKLKEMGFEAHWMISDKTKTVVVELIDGKIVATDCGKERAEDNTLPDMYNFYRYGVKYNADGSLYSPKDAPEHSGVLENNLGKNADGVERSNLTNKTYDSIQTAGDMMTFISGKLNDKAQAVGLAFSNLAFAAMDKEYWYTELIEGNEDRLAEDSPIEDFLNDKKVIDEIEKDAEAQRENNRYAKQKPWHTMHSSVYDLDELTLMLRSQEQEKTYEFKL